MPRYAARMDSLVSTQWLADELGAPDLVVLDASRHLPAAGRDPISEYEAGHVPGALFFDLARLVDTNSDVPQALPNPRQLADYLVALSIDPESRIVIYDDSAVKTSARAWFMLTAMGRDNVAILDGGLAKWREEGRAHESGSPEITASRPQSLATPTRVRTKANILANIDTQAEQLVDARSADRVFGSGIDPVHGGQNGRIPGSLNLPFGQLYNSDGTFKSLGELRRAFEDAGVDLERPIVTTCGSGVTASVLLFALHLIGKDDTALYDGSWMEWEADPDLPKAQGPEEGRPL